MPKGIEGFGFVSHVVAFVAWRSFWKPPGIVPFSFSPPSSVTFGISSLFLAPSSSFSGSAISDLAPVFPGSCLPVRAESRVDWYLYMITETEKSSIPSPNSTIANLYRPNVCKKTITNYYVKYSWHQSLDLRVAEVNYFSTAFELSSFITIYIYAIMIIRFLTRYSRAFIPSSTRSTVSSVHLCRQLRPFPSITQPHLRRHFAAKTSADEKVEELQELSVSTP